MKYPMYGDSNHTAIHAQRIRSSHLHPGFPFPHPSPSFCLGPSMSASFAAYIDPTGIMAFHAAQFYPPLHAETEHNFLEAAGIKEGEKKGNKKRLDALIRSLASKSMPLVHPLLCREIEMGILVGPACKV